jgi:hypothetical protein
MLWVVAAIIGKIALRGTASYFYVSPAVTTFCSTQKFKVASAFVSVVRKLESRGRTIACR